MEKGIIGIKLSLIRKDKGIGLNQMARMTGIKAPNISKIENGYTNPSVKTLNKLLKPLNHHIELSPDNEKDTSKIGRDYIIEDEDGIQYIIKVNHGLNISIVKGNLTIIPKDENNIGEF